MVSVCYIKSNQNKKEGYIIYTKNGNKIPNRESVFQTMFFIHLCKRNHFPRDKRTGNEYQILTGGRLKHKVLKEVRSRKG